MDNKKFKLVVDKEIIFNNFLFLEEQNNNNKTPIKGIIIKFINIFFKFNTIV